MRVEIYGCREGKTIDFFIYQTSQKETYSDDRVEFELLFESAHSNDRRIGLVTAFAAIRNPHTVLLSLQWRVIACYYKPFYSIQGYDLVAFSETQVQYK